MGWFIHTNLFHYYGYKYYKCLHTQECNGVVWTTLYPLVQILLSLHPLSSTKILSKCLLRWQRALLLAYHLLILSYHQFPPHIHVG
jgi:hypothetical protein